MEMEEIRAIARSRGVAPGGMGKTGLVRAIQRAEGRVDCYGTATQLECEEEDCLWREDCFFESAVEEIREPFTGGIRT